MKPSVKEPIKKQEEIFLLYKYCTPEWHPLIQLNLKIKEFQKDELIFKEGQEVRGMKFIKSGKVKVVSRDKNKEKIIRLAGEGAILGHRGLGSEQVYPVSAIALTDTSAYYISADVFYKLLRTNPELSFWLLNFLADELRNAENETKIMANYPVKQRITRTLLCISKAFGFSEKDKNLLAFTPTRKDIANMTGTTYETVIRVLSDLEKENLIDLVGKEISIKNPTKLRALVSDITNNEC